MEVPLISTWRYRSLAHACTASPHEEEEEGKPYTSLACVTNNKTHHIPVRLGEDRSQQSTHSSQIPQEPDS